MPDIGKQIANLRDRIESFNEIDQRDKQVLIKFSDRIDLLKSEYTDHRHNKLLRHCTILAENVSGLADALEDRDTAEDLVRWINRNYDNEYTNHDYRTALRVFARRITDGDDLPPSIEWIPSGMSNSHDPVPDPTNMLRWESDVLSMIDETRNSRDAALIAVAFDSGARSGELQNLTIGNVSDHEHGLIILVDGKTGQRSVTLVPSVPYLQRWLNDHPEPTNPDAPLWSKLTKPEEVSYRQFNDCFSDAGKRADIKKPVTPTNFRKSNATYLARQGMNQAFIEDRQGRERGSDATAHYIAQSGGEADNEYAKMHGLEVEEDKSEPLGPVECPRCQKDTPRHRETCVWCNQPLKYGAIESIEEDQQEIRDQVFRLAQEDPEFLEDIQQARKFSEMLEDNPKILEDAQAFADSLSEK